MARGKGKPVTLRGKKTAEGASPTMSFRCPPDLRRYVKDTAKNTGRDQTEIITDALSLDRDLAMRLKPDQDRLEAFAAANDLDMDQGLAEVLARLVRLGLDSLRVKK